MSRSNNWHCDICNSHWDHQQFPPAELLGIDERRRVCEPTGGGVYKHICRKCAQSIAESVIAASATTFDLSKIGTYYTQEAIDKRSGEAKE